MSQRPPHTSAIIEIATVSVQHTERRTGKSQITIIATIAIPTGTRAGITGTDIEVL